MERITAKIPITKTQKTVLFGGLFLLMFFCFISKTVVIASFLVIHIFYFSFVIYKVLIYLASFKKHKDRFTKDELNSLAKNPPNVIYTILLPVLKEDRIVHKLIKNIGNLQWNKENLQVLLLIEYNDELTQRAISEIELPKYVEVIVIPKGEVQTKPNACQYALQFVKGEFVVIYDAEDKPERDQLIKSFLSFRAYTEKVACLQAKLNYFNRKENLLAGLFCVDYTTWFDGFVKGLSNLGMTIPLGGTSNHFRTDILVRLNGWDSFNVTEDADLGIYLSEAGYETKYLNSTTYEEACMRVIPWIKQRTRWTMGYMITTLVHMRKKKNTLSLKNKISTFLFVTGTPLSNLFVPIVYTVTLTNYFLGWFGWLFPKHTDDFAYFLFWFGNLSMIFVGTVACLKRKFYLNALYSLLLPFYWLLSSIATYRAVYKLFTAPNNWEKTDHGISKEIV